MERLSDLTREMVHKSKMAGAMQYFWLLAKHNAGSPNTGLAMAAQEAKRFALTGGELERVLMAAVAVGTTTTAGWAQELSPYAGLTQEWVKSITAKTILGQLPYLRVPFRTSTIADVSPGSAAWVAEGMPIPASKMNLTKTAALDMKKVCALVPVTDELLESWGAAVQANLEDLISRTVRYAIDRSLLDPDQGVTTARPASLTNGIAAGQSTGSTAAQALADFKAMLTGPLTGTQDPSRVVIVMPPTSALFLSQLLTTGGSFAFPQLGALGGAISGVPVIVSPAAAMIGSPNSNIVAAVDASRVIVADEGLMLVDVASAAAIELKDDPTNTGVGGTVATSMVSMFQTHTKLLRISLYKNFIRANASAVSWFPVAY